MVEALTDTWTRPEWRRQGGALQLHTTSNRDAARRRDETVHPALERVTDDGSKAAGGARPHPRSRKSMGTSTRVASRTPPPKSTIACCRTIKSATTSSWSRQQGWQGQSGALARQPDTNRHTRTPADRVFDRGGTVPDLLEGARRRHRSGVHGSEEAAGDDASNIRREEQVGRHGDGRNTHELVFTKHAEASFEFDEEREATRRHVRCRRRDCRSGARGPVPGVLSGIATSRSGRPMRRRTTRIYSSGDV